ncbi:MAG: hypothetical protein ACI9O6_002483 [Glaciecola sp.]|jgi:hypothetical protein
MIVDLIIDRYNVKNKRDLDREYRKSDIFEFKRINPKLQCLLLNIPLNIERNSLLNYANSPKH